LRLKPLKELFDPTSEKLSDREEFADAQDNLKNLVDDQTHFKISNGVENNVINKKENKILCNYKISNNEGEIINKKVGKEEPNKKNENKLLRENKNLNKNLSKKKVSIPFPRY